MLLTVLAWFYSLVTLLGRVAWLRGLARALASRLSGQHPPGYRRAAPPSRAFSRTPGQARMGQAGNHSPQSPPPSRRLPRHLGYLQPALRSEEAHDGGQDLRRRARPPAPI